MSYRTSFVRVAPPRRIRTPRALFGSKKPLSSHCVDHVETWPAVASLCVLHVARRLTLSVARRHARHRAPRLSRRRVRRVRLERDGGAAEPRAARGRDGRVVDVIFAAAEIFLDARDATGGSREVDARFLERRPRAVEPPRSRGRRGHRGRRHLRLGARGGAPGGARGVAPEGDRDGARRLRGGEEAGVRRDPLRDERGTRGARHSGGPARQQHALVRALDVQGRRCRARVLRPGVPPRRKRKADDEQADDQPARSAQPRPRDLTAAFAPRDGAVRVPSHRLRRGHERRQRELQCLRGDRKNERTKEHRAVAD